MPGLAGLQVRGCWALVTSRGAHHSMLELISRLAKRHPWLSMGHRFAASSTALSTVRWLEILHPRLTIETDQSSSSPHFCLLG